MMLSKSPCTLYIYINHSDIEVLYILYTQTHSIIHYYCAANIICRTSDRYDSMRTALIYSTRLPIHTTIGMPTPGQTSINYRPSNYDVPLLLTNASSTTSDTLLYNTLYIIGIIYYYYIVQKHSAAA